MKKYSVGVFLLLCAIGLLGCSQPTDNRVTPALRPNTAPDPQLAGRGTVEVTAKLIEVPAGAIVKRDLYDYATILKYEIITVHRGKLKKGDIIYVGHYNPWKSRAEAADKHVKNIGGKLRNFRAGATHHMALETPMEDLFMGGLVDKYFDKRSGPTYWAVWTNDG